MAKNKEGKKEKKKFYKRVWFWVVAIIVVIGIANMDEDDTETASSDVEAESKVEEPSDTASRETETESEETSGSDDSEEEKEDASDKKDAEAAEENEVQDAKIGDTAEVGGVGFTVSDVEETAEIVSDNEFMDNASTDGTFVIVDLDVENGKDESITINSSYFTLITDEGSEYDPITDGEVMMALGDSSRDFFLKQINPGLNKSGKVVFEVGGDVDVSSSTLKAKTGLLGTETVEIKLSE